MKSLLPLILVILLLTGAITYSLSKATLPKLVTKQEAVSPNELEIDSFTTPTPVESPSPKATPTKSIAKSVVEIVPTITIKKSLSEVPSTGSKDVETITTKVTKTNICTPVYGSADTCVEHIVVDTAGEDSIFFNMAGFSYLAGLVAFIKAKKA